MHQDVAIFSVSKLTEQLRFQIEKTFPFVWVRGEIANFKLVSAGHIYFTLKDRDAQLQCVWFRGQQALLRSATQFDPLTGEVFEQGRSIPEFADGMEVLCAGQISVYASRGQYQLIIELVQPSGDGQQALALEKLKRKLEMAGYFALERKRPLPANPRRVALLTSPTGAAIHDFLKLAASRGCGSHIRLFPVLVQGAGAAADIAKALAVVNEQSWAEVVVLIRGGGAQEDLQVFNDEIVANAIFASRIPVLAAIGHEVDTCFADMTADVRAATPSHAAASLWPLKRDMMQGVDALDLRLQHCVSGFLRQAENAVSTLQKALQWNTPLHCVLRKEEQCTSFAQRLAVCLGQMIDKREYIVGLAAQKIQEKVSFAFERCNNDIAIMETRLLALDPKAPLQRGYALLQAKDGKIVRSVSQVRQGQGAEIILADGLLDVTVDAVRDSMPH